MIRRAAIFTIFLGAMALVSWPVAVFGQQALSGSATATKTLRFRLKINRIAPTSVTVPAGNYLLVLENGIALADLDFELDNPQSVALTAARMPRGASRLSRKVILTPGKHTLRVIGQPKWTCEIKVTPK